MILRRVKSPGRRRTEEKQSEAGLPSGLTAPLNLILKNSEPYLSLKSWTIYQYSTRPRPANHLKPDANCPNCGPWIDNPLVTQTPGQLVLTLNATFLIQTIKREDKRQGVQTQTKVETI